MVPLSLSLHNFLSYGDQVPLLDFTQFQVACLTGNNGHGKSALLDAITYALWGEARKSQHERRPDEGLLRLGATEMRVEFCFALDEGQFRVIRSFRKGRRAGVAQLELQLFDRASNTFRSLSENASLTRTQERIEQLLSMNYDTFINSAFIVQGRADEFTQRNARQRKEILAEILGLSRYDRLQEIARQHQQEKQQRCQEYQRRLQELDTELTQQAEWERQLGELARQLEALSLVLAEAEAQVEEWREKRLERDQLQRHSEECQGELARLGARRGELEKAQQHLHRQQQKDEETLAAAEAIQQDFAAYHQLAAQDSQLSAKRQRHSELEEAARRLEGLILAARHEVEQRRSSWEARCHTLQNQLQHSRSLLEQQQAIEARYHLLLAARQQFQVLEVQRLRHETLTHEQGLARHRIDAEKQSLEVRGEGLQAQAAELRQRVQKKPELESRVRELEQEIAGLRLQAEERDRLREEGSALRAQGDQAQRQLELQEERLKKAREKLLLLQTAPQAACPLCGSRLDEAHRRQLDQELARQEREDLAALEAQRQRLQDLEGRLEGMRQRYQHLEQQTQALPARQQEWTRLSAHLGRLAEEEERLRQLEVQVADLDRRLAGGDYAAEHRRRLQQFEAELIALDYHPEEQARLRERLEELAAAEADWARLQDARAREEQLRAELAEAEQKLATAQRYLEDRRYAQQEQRDLDGLRRQLEELAYDPALHQQIRLRLDSSSDAVARRERLIAAQQRHAATQEQIERNAAELLSLSQQLQEAAARLARDQQRLRELEGTEAQFAAASQRLARARLERDQLLQRQGAAQTHCQRCAELGEERTEVRARLDEAQREAWIYQQLDAALGKDGIQALIIESAIPEIEQEANAILSRLTDNRIQIAIESLRDLKKGGTRETLDLKIADELGERSYHLYSGGEAFRTNFALRLALSKVLARRAGARLRTLIIDEGFGTQDPQGLEQLVESIQEISKDFDKVLVVTHLPELKKAFPVQIEVTKHPELGSRFEVIHNF